MLKERYQRNHNTINEDELPILNGSKICVVGCGGLGGHIIDMLVRVGIGNLTVVDGDVFVESNLNRQLLSKESNLGKSKAQEAGKYVHLINSQVELTIHDQYLNDDNAYNIIEGCNVVIDALDNVKSRLLLEKACFVKKIPLIHGAIGGWYGQVAVVLPGSHLLTKLYSEDSGEGEERILGNPSFTPANIASIQVAECIKYILNKESALTNSILQIDLLTDSFDIVSIE